MYPNYCQRYKIITVDQHRDFELSISENYYKLLNKAVKKYLLLLPTEWIEKIADPSNAKEYYISYLKKKKTKLIKWSKITTQKQKTFENPNIVDIKSVITEYQKTSRKLSKTIRQAEKIPQLGSCKSFNNPLYDKTKTKVKPFWMQE